MFGNSKPLASLSSGLLARKGQARPAMRPQGFVGSDMSLEDLGWNDLGEGRAAAPVQPLTPETPVPVEAPTPAVVVQREALSREVAPPVVATAELAAIGAAVATRKGKAAFTLRLDADRHLKLRLASAIEGRSAQAIVTQALDEYVTKLAEVEALSAQLRPGNGNR